MPQTALVVSSLLITKHEPVKQTVPGVTHTIKDVERSSLSGTAPGCYQ